MGEVRKYNHPIIEQEAIDDVVKILKSGKLSGFKGYLGGHLGGVWVQRLEQSFRDYHDIKHAVAFNSATSALHASLIACGIGVWDEVITSPFTFSASASCIKMVGAKPKFVDIDPDTFNLDPGSIYEVWYPSCKAIIPVHLMGHPCLIRQIVSIARGRGMKVIEDASQSLGAEYMGQKVGTFGDCGVFSFNQSKPISVGEGGMLITNDDKIAEVARAVRNHGEVSTDLNILGYNYRMCEVEACLAWHQFQKIDEMNEHRIKLANHLTEALDKVDGLTPPTTYSTSKHVFFTYGVKCRDRDGFQKKMADAGIYFGKGGMKPLHLHPFYGGGQLSVAERMWKEVAFTDIFKYPMSIEDVDEIIGVINEKIQS